MLRPISFSCDLSCHSKKRQVKEQYVHNNYIKAKSDINFYQLSCYNSFFFFLSWRSFSSIYATLISTLKSKLLFSSFNRLIDRDFCMKSSNQNSQISGSFMPLKKKQFHITMSRGPMVRKKRSLFYVGFSSRRVFITLEMTSLGSFVPVNSNMGGSSIVSLLRICKDIGYLGLNLSNYSSWKSLIYICSL